MKLEPPTHPALWTPAATTTIEEARSHIAGMRRIMLARKALGLSATQVGLSIRLFLMRGPPIEVFINPGYIANENSEFKSDDEGCLTWPGKRRSMKRWTEILASWTDLEGRQRSRTFTDIYARIFQHETDHLNGICLWPRP